jgi:hypothetical protein
LFNHFGASYEDFTRCDYKNNHRGNPYCDKFEFLSGRNGRIEISWMDERLELGRLGNWRAARLEGSRNGLFWDVAEGRRLLEALPEAFQLADGR